MAKAIRNNIFSIRFPVDDKKRNVKKWAPFSLCKFFHNNKLFPYSHPNK